MTDSTSLTYRLRRPDAAAVGAPELDESQRAVVDHRGGPLLVLAGPGTGKTTTLVELVAQRVAAGELQPSEVLMLTFSRKSAEEMRSRVSARLDGGPPVLAATFHSWCYALVRAHADPAVFAEPPTLMTAPESDVVIAELLAGHEVESWPAELRPALRTRGFATELGSFLGALAARAMTTDDLRARAVELDRRLWLRVAEVLDEYAEVTDLQNLTDYAELVVRTSALLDDPQVLDEVRAGLKLVVVDEYQDTDPAQVEVLRKLVGPGQQLIAVGDHDQAIYGFRGADADGLGQFPDHFPGAEVTVLRTTRRFGRRIRDAAVTVLPPVQAAGLGVEMARRHRDLECRADHGDGEVSVLTFASDIAESEQIAQILQREHLEHQRPWGDMAVLVRTSAQLARLQRALVEADVPCEVAGDEIPLVAEPAVRVLLGALSAADTLARGDGLDPEVAHALVTGPLAGVDAPDLRAFGRRLRRHDPDTPSRILLAEALAGLGEHDDVANPVIRALARLLAKAAQMIRDGEPAEQVLWLLWSETAWPQRLEAAWAGGGSERAAADRDLDAVVALFHHAARSEERHRRRSVAGFLADLRSQRLPADRLADSSSRGDAMVRLMTAHRAKGLEWPVVIVAGVQEDIWPDVSLRTSLLRPDQLVGEPPSVRARLAEERRVMYVALTRARERLVVTAVDTGADDACAPSRFHTELLAAGFGSAPRQGRPTRPLSLRGLVTELRRSATDTDPQVRASAAGLLARIAGSRAARARAAHPDTWWGITELTENDTPLRPVAEPLGLSGSSLTTISQCPVHWFLSREARGSRGSTTAQGFGLVVHAIAADVVRRGIRDPDVAELHAQLDSVWQRLGHETAWISERERAEAYDALDRFAHWHAADSRRPLGAEHEFTAEMTIDGERVVLRGSMDRIELDADDLVHVVDFKTGRSQVSAKDLAEHPQLGVYSLAVREGAVEGYGQVGGSELVQLRQPAGTRNPELPKVQRQAAPEPGEFFVHDLIRHAVKVMRTEEFYATSNSCTYCEFDMVCPGRTTFTIGSER